MNSVRTHSSIHPKLAHRSLPALVALTLIVVAAISVPAADWPQWRGPNRDGISQEKDLLPRWPQEGPKLVWKATDIGSGCLWCYEIRAGASNN